MFEPIVPIFDINNQILQQPKPATRIEPIGFYSDEKFRKRYRFSKATFAYICHKFEDEKISNGFF